MTQIDAAILVGISLGFMLGWVAGRLFTVWSIYREKARRD